MLSSKSEGHIQQILINSNEGFIVLKSGFLDSKQAKAYFVRLKTDISWEQKQTKMFGNIVKFPRLTAWYGALDYKYSGVQHTAADWILVLAELKEMVEDTVGQAFNSVLCNYYRDGKDSIGWHSDDEKELGENPCIASLSFGETRSFKLKHKATGIIHTIDLPAGSLLIMSGATQKNWLHSVPKRTKNSAERINLTFRNIFPI
ncbi:MAG: alpha-ketoglutarate-dependent dioxygenase AlkB [Gammaproteobacteria bacterium]|nr:alpha-ketoglutarate-dependent dioxygenase AlkB [Gammaproteobacteria bacterium]